VTRVVSKEQEDSDSTPQNDLGDVTPEEPLTARDARWLQRRQQFLINKGSQIG